MKKFGNSSYICNKKVSVVGIYNGKLEMNRIIMHILQRLAKCNPQLLSPVKYFYYEIMSKSLHNKHDRKGKIQEETPPEVFDVVVRWDRQIPLVTQRKED